MKDHEKSAFVKVLTVMAELYGKKMSPALITIYWLALKPFEWTDVQQGIHHHVMNAQVGQYMPKPADIVRFLEGDRETLALQAWSKVESAIRKIGRYDSVVFDDPLIHAVIIEMGGWSRLCGTLTQDMPFRANEFIKRYSRYYHTKLPHYPAHLVGTIEQCRLAENDVNENRTAPVLVGDEQLARAVLQGGEATHLTGIHRQSQAARNFIKKQPTEDLHCTRHEMKEAKKIRENKRNDVEG